MLPSMRGRETIYSLSPSRIRTAFPCRPTGVPGGTSSSAAVYASMIVPRCHVLTCIMASSATVIPLSHRPGIIGCRGLYNGWWAGLAHAGGVARLVSWHPQPFVRIDQRQRRAVPLGVLVVAVGVGELLSRAEEAAQAQLEPPVSQVGDQRPPLAADRADLKDGAAADEGELLAVLAVQVRAAQVRAVQVHAVQDCAV